ncbi:MAG: hypothetical protein QXL27_05160 [Candidatus Bathyarchaeia archaeon]
MSNNMFFKRRRIDFREILLKLNLCLELTEENLHRAKCYVKSLYVSYLTMYALGDRYKSMIYVAEISEAEYMVELMSRVCLALERAIIRLKIFSEFYDVFSFELFEGGIESLGNIMSSTLNSSIMLIDSVRSSSQDLITSTMLDSVECELDFEGLTVKNLAEGLVRHLMEKSREAS